jgi:hypothetical protein
LNAIAGGMGDDTRSGEGRENEGENGEGGVSEHLGFFEGKFATEEL